MGGVESVAVLLRERKALAFVKRNDEDAGFRCLDHWCLGEVFRRR
jgi:hypothetical protein